MRGLRCACSAAKVGPGIVDLRTNSSGLPVFAAQPAAGIANAGSSADASTTARLAWPTAALWSRSIAAASALGSSPAIVVERYPPGAGALPTRTTCAPPSSEAPVGASASSASALAAGRSLPSDSSNGARSGSLISTAAASPACQMRWSASTTARGRVAGTPSLPAGYTARATAAASAIGSAPPTRVVFFVANAGKPSCCGASGSFPARPICGLSSRLGSPPQPAPSDAASTSRRHARPRRRRMRSAQGGDDPHRCAVAVALCADRERAVRIHEREHGGEVGDLELVERSQQPCEWWDDQYERGCVAVAERADRRLAVAAVVEALLRIEQVLRGGGGVAGCKSVALRQHDDRLWRLRDLHLEAACPGDGEGADRHAESGADDCLDAREQTLCRDGIRHLQQCAAADVERRLAAHEDAEAAERLEQISVEVETDALLHLRCRLVMDARAGERASDQGAERRGRER